MSIESRPQSFLSPSDQLAARQPLQSALVAPPDGDTHAIVVTCQAVTITILIDRHGPTAPLDPSRQAANPAQRHGRSPLPQVHLNTASLTDLLYPAREPDASRDGVIKGPGAQGDPVIDEVRRALAAMGLEERLGACCASAVRRAIVARMAAGSAASSPVPQVPGRLSKWRLRRVVDYVNEHVAERISLSDLASAAGLTRMHFAAQFKLATGMRPHDYILRYRINTAQRQLLESDQSLVDIACGVGFQTQAHFTTVFKRLVGQTPHRWRQSVREQAVADESSSDLDAVTSDRNTNRERQAPPWQGAALSYQSHRADDDKPAWNNSMSRLSSPIRGLIRAV